MGMRGKLRLGVAIITMASAFACGTFTEGAGKRGAPTAPAEQSEEGAADGRARGAAPAEAPPPEDAPPPAAAPPPPPEAAPPPPEAAPPPPPPANGCGKDTDCKGDRICVNGSCVFPR